MENKKEDLVESKSIIERRIRKLKRINLGSIDVKAYHYFVGVCLNIKGLNPLIVEGETIGNHILVISDDYKFNGTFVSNEIFSVNLTPYEFEKTFESLDLKKVNFHSYSNDGKLTKYIKSKVRDELELYESYMGEAEESEEEKRSSFHYASSDSLDSGEEKEKS